LICVAALAHASPALAAKGSLYRGPAPRPGPAMLYREPAKAPQLSNRGIWHAKPILVSGASAYRRGEFLYQDYLYDDHGAKGTSRDPNDPRTEDPTFDAFSRPNGTYTYPSARAYANNAADLVELRVKPRRRATAFRITLNTLKDPSLVATTIAIGSSKQPREVPHGANATAPADLFLTVHGHRADLVRARSGKAATPCAGGCPPARSSCRPTSGRSGWRRRTASGSGCRSPCARSAAWTARRWRWRASSGRSAGDPVSWSTT
jgi:hypothetical protein